MSKKKKIAYHTFGCKLNFAETSAISRELPPELYEVAESHEKADIFVIHSCTVTEAAEKKCNQFIRHLRRENPGSSIIIMGCYAQLNPQKLEAMPEVDLVLDNKEKFELARYLEDLTVRKGSHEHVSPGGPDTRFIPSFSLGDRTRSFLKIQDGCDYYCSYCTIPFARGHSRSATVAQILQAAQQITDAGIKEIVLTGVNIGDFGKHHGITLFDLLVEMENKVPIPRIRISSIEPDLLDDRIIQLVAGSPKLMPHFHIPLQSGSNSVLKAMKRKYDRELFAERVKRVKDRMPHACIAADVITGFPGEAEEDFAESFRFIEGLDIAYLHVFTYSERPLTLSSKFENTIRPEVKKQRSKILHELSAAKKQQFYAGQRGQTRLVLFESDPNRSFLFGFTENYIHVKTDYRDELINQIIPVTLNEMDGDGNYVLFLQDPVDG